MVTTGPPQARPRPARRPGGPPWGRPGDAPRSSTAIEGTFAEVSSTPIWRKFLSLIGIIGIIGLVGLAVAATFGLLAAVLAEILDTAF